MTRKLPPAARLSGSVGSPGISPASKSPAPRWWRATPTTTARALQVRRRGIGTDVEIAGQPPVAMRVDGPTSDDDVVHARLPEALKQRRGIELAHRRARKTWRNSSAERSSRMASSRLRPTPLWAFLRTASRRARRSRSRSSWTRAGSPGRAVAMVQCYGRRQQARRGDTVATRSQLRHRSTDVS
jgi:hypothetical protein